MYLKQFVETDTRHKNLSLALNKNITHFFINNQKFKQLPRKYVISGNLILFYKSR